ncbi:MAG: hypothetical protein MZV70_34995 [Desulfobacterales bacterium]|nr:hypothetical protein [Desulfobacterales bacterium]
MDLSGNIILAADYEGFLYISKKILDLPGTSSKPGEKELGNPSETVMMVDTVATDEVGKLFVSKNYGNDWNRCEPVTDDVYWGEANSRCNSEGSHIVHIRGLDYAYQSYDYGITWKESLPQGPLLVYSRDEFDGNIYRPWLFVG